MKWKHLVGKIMGNSEENKAMFCQGIGWRKMKIEKGLRKYTKEEEKEEKTKWKRWRRIWDNNKYQKQLCQEQNEVRFTHMYLRG